MKSYTEKFDAIIVGSGIGGLVTASQLASRVQKFWYSRNIIPGGSGGSFKERIYL